MGDLISPEEAETIRAAYTWSEATSDLAYNTSLTLMEATEVTIQLRRTGVHPYDALPILVRIFKDVTDRGNIARALVDLIKLAEETD